MANALVVIFMGSRPDYSVSDKIQNCLKALSVYSVDR